MSRRTQKILIVMILAVVALTFMANAFMPLIHRNAAETEADIDAKAERYEPVGPQFSAEKAFELVEKQCAFGPRAMNTAGHEQCGEWIVEQFQSLGCAVETQRATLTGYDGTPLQSTNIIAKVNPEATPRILICAHWDSRPWADNDPNEENWRKPILAANDAASGVAVMMELARLLQADSTFHKGIDFVCFDAEDWGTPQWADQPDRADTWALGAQYYADHLSNPDFVYGILLDMVGGQGAQFYQEVFSKQYAPDVVRRIWRAARAAGYGSYFPKKTGGGITDDHIPLNKRGIPVVDIIPYYPNCPQSSFGPTWHTLQDDLQHIDKNTLRAVGQTLVQVLYQD